MKVYSFKCKCCGSREYKKIDSSTYKCDYCGAKEEVIKTPEVKQFIKEKINSSDAEFNELTIELKSKRSLFLKKLIALMLCVFAGTMGLHKFYEGKIGMGILYLFTFALFGVGWIVDIIKLAFQINDASREVNYLQSEIYLAEIERNERIDMLRNGGGGYEN